MRDADTARQLECLYRAHGPEVLCYLARRSCADEAAHLMADVFEVVWRRRHHLPADGEDRLWMFEVARNVLHDRRRVQRPRHRDDTRQLADRIREATQTPTRAELDLRLALEVLHPLDQEIITMTFWERLNFAEIATVLQQPASTVEDGYRRACVRLGGILCPDETDPGTATAPAGER